MNLSHEEIESATTVVLSFTHEMNIWETRMYYKSRIENGEFVSETNTKLVIAASYEDIKNEYYDVFNRHCTQRKRTYGGFPSGWSKGGQYAGIDKDAVLEVKISNPSQAEVIVKGGQFPENRFKFVLFKKYDEWKIDNAFWNDSEFGKWERHHL